MILYYVLSYYELWSTILGFKINITENYNSFIPFPRFLICRGNVHKGNKIFFSTRWSKKYVCTVSPFNHKYDKIIPRSPLNIQKENNPRQISRWERKQLISNVSKYDCSKDTQVCMEYWSNSYIKLFYILFAILCLASEHEYLYC